MHLAKRTIRYGYVCFIALFASVCLSACGKKDTGKAGEEKIVIFVNNEPVFASDIKRSLALKAKQDPLFKVTQDAEQDQLDNIIDRKLIIQEALNKGLAREGSFVQTIKAFWEQALIREFIDYKKKEFQKYLYVTDAEVNNYYQNMGKRVTFKLYKSRDKKVVDDLYRKIRGNEPVATDGWDIMGPIGYDDITSGVLSDAFVLALGDAKKFYEEPYHYLVIVIDRQDAASPSIDAIRPVIEKRIRALKEQRLFDEWLKEKRQKATIRKD